MFAQASVTPALAPTIPSQAAPDVELRAHVEARQVKIKQDGPIRLDLHAKPGTTDVEVVRSQPGGARTYRHLVIDARVAARLDQAAGEAATPSTTGEPQ